MQVAFTHTNTQQALFFSIITASILNVQTLGDQQKSLIWFWFQEKLISGSGSSQTNKEINWLHVGFSVQLLLCLQMQWGEANIEVMLCLVIRPSFSSHIPIGLCQRFTHFFHRSLVQGFKVFSFSPNHLVRIRFNSQSVYMLILRVHEKLQTIFAFLTR